jgi:hypothetical protein
MIHTSQHGKEQMMLGAPDDSGSVVDPPAVVYMIEC